MKRHLIILSVPIALMVGASWMLYRDFRREEGAETSDEPAMASVFSAQGDVKRKPSNRLSWRALGPESPVFRRDSVRTTTGSTATLKFADGSQIEIGENSMIVLEKTKDRMAIEFVSGNLLTQGGGKGLVLRSQGMEINAADAKVELSGTGGAASVNVQGGKVTVASASGAAVEIHENQKADLKAGAVGEVQDLPARPRQPAENALLLTNETRTLVDFEWETSKNLPGSKLEVATDREFRNRVKSIRAEGRNSVSRVGLDSGSYYWRLADENHALSQVHRLEIAQKTPVRLLDPPEKHTVRYTHQTPKLGFSWIAPPYYDNVKIEIASDPSFTKIVAAIPGGQDQKVSAEITQTGELYWRIQASSTRGAPAETSVARALILRKLDKLEPPTLLAPKSGIAVSAGATGTADVDLRWSGSEDAQAYRVEISRGEDFSKPILVESPRADTKWQAPATGRYFWRVSALGPDHAPLSVSSAQPFLVVSGTPLALEGPAEREPFEYADSPPEITLRWEAEKQARTYEIELAKDVGFTDGLTRSEAKEPSFQLKRIADGTWFWRVRALDSAGAPIRASQARAFELRHNELLAVKPEILTPAPRAVIELDEEGLATALSWRITGRSPAGEAAAVASYEVAFQPVGSPSAQPQIVRAESLSLGAKRLPPGEFDWKVRAVTKDGRKTPFSEPRRITVRAPAAIPKPTIYPIQME